MKTLLTLSLAALALSATLARADSFSVSYLAAGIQASTDSTKVETFDNASIVNGQLTTTFNGSGITGTYTGGFGLSSADQFGGAGGTGKYITTGPYTGYGTSYTLTLSSSVNYFGLWFSALDAGNQISFYNGNTLLYSFGASNFINAVGACPGSAYCGNPNNQQDPYEQFAFINFFDSNGSFNKIVFTEPTASNGGFESDNHTVANLTSAPGGTVLTPEPTSLLLMGTGLVGAMALYRRRFRAV